jgi:hypothetical protein
MLKIEFKWMTWKSLKFKSLNMGVNRTGVLIRIVVEDLLFRPLLEVAQKIYKYEKQQNQWNQLEKVKINILCFQYFKAF